MASRRRKASKYVDWNHWSSALRLIYHDHSEIYTHSRTGEQIMVRCECAIGHDHNYAEWVESMSQSGETARGQKRPPLAG